MPRLPKASVIIDLREEIAGGTKKLVEAIKGTPEALQTAIMLLTHVKMLVEHSSFHDAITETNAHLVWLGNSGSTGSVDYRLMFTALHCITNNVSNSDLCRMVRQVEYRLRECIERRTEENRKAHTAVREIKGGKFSWFKPAPTL